MQSFLGLYHLNSDIKELPTAVKEEYLRRAILLMDHHPMVSILEKKVFFVFSTMTLSIRRGREPPAAISEFSSESKISL